MGTSRSEWGRWVASPLDGPPCPFAPFPDLIALSAPFPDLIALSANHWLGLCIMHQGVLSTGS